MGHFFPQALYVLAAGAAGAVGGWSFFRCWRAVMPTGRSRTFWTALPLTLRRMLTTEDPSEVLRHYGAFIGTTARYAARNTGAVLVGVLPTSALFLLLTVLDPSEHLTTLVEVQPASAIAPDSALPHHIDDERIVIDRQVLANSSVRVAGGMLDSVALPGKHGWCASTLACFLFEMMLFDTHAIGEHAAGSSPVISRPMVFDRNPFWPYLNDLEFTFFVAVVLGSALAAWWRHARQPVPA